MNLMYNYVDLYSEIYLRCMQYLEWVDSYQMII